MKKQGVIVIILVALLGVVFCLGYDHQVRELRKQVCLQHKLIKAYEQVYDDFDIYMMDGGGIDKLANGDLPAALEKAVHDYEIVDSIYALEQ